MASWGGMKGPEDVTRLKHRSRGGRGHELKVTIKYPQAASHCISEAPTPNPGSSTVNTEPAVGTTVPVARSPKEPQLRHQVRVARD